MIPLSLYACVEAYRNTFPPSAPVVVTDVRSFDTPLNTWMVSGHASYAGKCETIVIKRIWDGIPLGITPRVVASSGNALDQQFIVKRKSGDEVDFWTEFEKVPGFVGIYRMSVSATGCENGFVGPKTVLDQRFQFPPTGPGK